MLLVWAWTEWVCIVAGKCLFLAGRPSIITCTTFLGKGPSLPQGSWWCVLRVRSWCLSTEGSGLVYQLENLWVQLASQSFLVGQPQLYCCAKSLFSPPFFVFSSPSFPRVDPSSASCFPNPFTFLHLAPLSPLSFFFCPFTPFRLSS